MFLNYKNVFLWYLLKKSQSWCLFFKKHPPTQEKSISTFPLEESVLSFVEASSALALLQLY